MKPYTITLISKNKEVFFTETVNAIGKNEAWDMVRDRVIDAICKKGSGEIDIKEG